MVMLATADKNGKRFGRASENMSITPSTKFRRGDSILLIRFLF